MFPAHYTFFARRQRECIGTCGIEAAMVGSILPFQSRPDAVSHAVLAVACNTKQDSQ